MNINKDSLDCEEADAAIETDPDLGMWDSSDDDATDFFDSDDEPREEEEELLSTHIDNPDESVSHSGSGSGQVQIAAQALSEREKTADKEQQPEEDGAVTEKSMFTSVEDGPRGIDQAEGPQPSMVVEGVTHDKISLTPEEAEEHAMNDLDGWEGYAGFAMGDIDEHDLSSETL